MWFKVSYQAWKETILLSFFSFFICEASDWSSVCVASVWGALSLKVTLVSQTCHHTRITCHVHWSSVEPAKKPRKQRVCGETVEVPPLISYWNVREKKKENVCWLWVTSTYDYSNTFWKQTAFKSAVCASSLCNPQVSLCVTTPSSALVKLLIPRC